jgi:hypothetical protein
MIKRPAQVDLITSSATVVGRVSGAETKMHAIYKRYPMMWPYVGANYERGGPLSLLLVGESHYLPASSTQHHAAEGWYLKDASTLNPKERSWISTAEIINGSSAEGFRNRAHSIYRKSFLEINRSGPNYPDYRRVGDVVVFYNYFLRPARQGSSLQVCEEDERVAEEVFRSVFGEYRPAAVVFLSKLAFRSWQVRSAHSISVPIASTPHPGCAHWNRVSSKYGGRRGREVLGEFIKRVWCPAEPIAAPGLGRM